MLLSNAGVRAVFTRGRFGYWRCLRLCVCVYVRARANHELVRTITHHPFKLGSPNSGQSVKDLVLQFRRFHSLNPVHVY